MKRLCPNLHIDYNAEVRPALPIAICHENSHMLLKSKGISRPHDLYIELALFLLFALAQVWCAHSHSNGGDLDEGPRMLHVDFKKWQCCMSLSLIFPIQVKAMSLLLFLVPVPCH